MAGQRILYGARHAGQRRLMQDEIDAMADILHERQILNIALDKVNATTDVGKILQASGGKIIYAADFMPKLQQPMGQGRTDKSRNACNQIARHRKIQSLVSGYLINLSLPAS